VARGISALLQRAADERREISAHRCRPRRATPLTINTLLLPVLAGVPMGLAIGLIGGGGSILAVPLLVYVVGVSSPHVAVATAAIAVALNAATGVANHARIGNIKWPCALVFAAAGIGGAVLGAEAGKAIEGARLLAAFGVLMIVVGALLLKPRRTPPQPDVRLSRDTAGRLLPRLIPIGFGVGLLAGFFGIGGGFLIVPGLMLATAMPLGTAIGTSLVIVTALGAATASSYAWSGFVDWPMSLLLMLGGAVGSAIGMRVGRRIAERRRVLEIAFACVVMTVGAFVLIEAALANATAP
jgi:uncharacterized membrane protein YfcA